MAETSSFYGRTRELDELALLLDDVLEGKTRTAFITGEAGAGKSTLLETFIERAQTTDSALIATLATCNSHTGQSDAYLPFLDTLAQLTGDARRFKSGSISETNTHRLESFFEVAVRAIVEDVPELIGQFIPGGSLIFHTISFTARKAGLLKKRDTHKLRRQIDGKIEADKIYQLYADLLAKLATHAPLIIVLEDLHWVDQSSAQLLFSLSRRIVDSPILFLGTYRPNDIATGRGGDRHPLIPVIHELKRVHGDIFIDLGEETESERAAFVAAMLDAEAPGLGVEFRRSFLEHTNGHALFSRELLNNFRENQVITRSESGKWVLNRSINWSDLPPRVEGVIEERIDRLNEELREIASVASVQGDVFLVEILARLNDLSRRALLHALSRQLESIHGLIEEVEPLKIGGKRLDRFRFSHSLFQQYLYNQLGRAERRHMHAEVAGLLEAEYGEARHDIANLLAYHFATAEDWARAVHYYLAAARRSLVVSSYDAALDLLQSGLALTSELGAEDAAPAELEIRLELGTIHQALRGFTNPEAEKNFRLALEIATRIGDRQRLALAMFGLWESHLFKLELDLAEDLALGIKEISRTEDDNVLGVVAYRALANVSYQKGELDDTIAHAGEVVDRYQPEELNAYILRLTYDPKLFALGMKSWAESLTGRLARAEETIASMFAWADELDHPVSTCVAHLSALKLHYNLGNVTAIREHAAEMRELARKYGLFWYNAFGEFFGAWHAAMTSPDPANAGAFSDEFQRIYRTGVAPDGNLLIHSQFSRMISEALIEFGALEQALTFADEGIAVSEACGEKVYLAELMRIKGVILLKQGAPKASAAQLDRSIKLAAQSGHKLFELRARTWLCRALAAGDQPTDEALGELRALLDLFSDQSSYVDVETARRLL